MSNTMAQIEKGRLSTSNYLYNKKSTILFINPFNPSDIVPMSCAYIHQIKALDLSIVTVPSFQNPSKNLLCYGQSKKVSELDFFHRTKNVHSLWPVQFLIFDIGWKGLFAENCHIPYIKWLVGKL